MTRKCTSFFDTKSDCELMHRKGFCTLNRSVFTVVYENARYLPWFSKTLDIYRGFRKHAVFQVCKTIFARYLSKFLKHTNECWLSKRCDIETTLDVGPTSARDLPQTSIHTFRCNNSFLMFLLILFRFSSVNIEGSG